MQAILISTVAVALAEIGDKTQLLALVLAARYGRPWPIIAGITLATIANHAVAGALGVWLSALVPEVALRWGLALSFIAMGLWLLVPDSEDDAAGRYPYGVFVTTLIAFFLVEIGDKTQVATVVLAARFDPAWLVIAGTTLGMLAANVPVVIMGRFAADRLPMRAIHGAAAVVFIGLGVVAGLGYGGA
ncbi:TMEM165/GDT1 family protein [Arhodomonas sp. AD133]|uniref:TMEM165/GDT1 family protein n=1 Tax=Arhodomonas sp. AD133 TaxID=3415009 RepID=UPI003EBA7253